MVGARTHFTNWRSKQKEVKNMALYDDFDLDITTGTPKDMGGTNQPNRLPTRDECYTTGPDTCDCTTDTCGGFQGSPCDR